ncbi:Protein TORNADO 2 [Raphanus sativus]|uniref:Protein TORNADO 2-like n=1 Tax=Raphanus sativus TaxID=3726 RepID=A0A6J0M6Z4_RAPSA|nr:protein TORNADO 2-like [Raphanus sativus]KAJ4901458.1 Protein TORNADO 2 [Raphanus sativus]
MPLGHHVIGCMNFISVLLSIPVISAGIWLSMGAVNSCFKLFQWPIIILGILILLVGLAGLIGGFWRITWLLVVSLIAMFALIVLLSVLIGFIYMVSMKGSGHPEPSRAYLEYSLQDFSSFLRQRVQKSYKWDRIRTCLSATSICPKLNQTFPIALDFFNAHLSPIQSGCCKPPTQCGFQFVSPTNWIGAVNVSADTDCQQWSNVPDTLCYSCDSCKAGLLANLKVDWLKADICLLLAFIGLIIAYLTSCCLRNGKTESILARYKQGDSYT